MPPSPFGPRCLGPFASDPRRGAVSRRSLVQAGTLGLAGFGVAGGTVGLPDLLAARAMASTGAAGFGRAKACILLFMWGGPSHVDTLDMKPHAPPEVRGPFKPVATNVPGLEFSELFERLPRHADKLTVIRSMGHNDPAHLSSAHAAVTGHLAPNLVSDDDPPSPKDSPHVGAVVAKLRELRGESVSGLPSSVILPWKVFHPAAPGGQAPGQHGGWLGAGYDPFLVTGDLGRPDWRVPELGLIDGVSPARLSDRQSLLSSLDAARRRLDTVAEVSPLGPLQRQAFDLLAGSSTREAFDLSRESPETRDEYGRNIHGQGVLLARRLVERGVLLVCVNWHNDGKNFWDTHGNNFNRLKDELVPPADRALSALLTDLETRGMLDETIVAWIGEFGRRPLINPNTGRDHWPFCYSGLLAGAGLPGGRIYGASDRLGNYPISNPTSPRDYVATLYHALGINPEMRLPDMTGRDIAFCDGRALTELWA